jgi:hypothetical protein
MAIVLAEMRRSTGWLFLTFFNNRILHDPREAGMYAILSLVHPAIGPNPSVVEIYRGLSMVSYNPFTITRYSWIQGVGVIAWVTLLFRCARKGLQEDRTRPYVWLLLSWLLFNAILHNLWGDEFFLYSPHWSWALMGLILLGARHVSLRFIAAMVIPLVVAQIHTLLAIRSALRSITW